MHEMPAVITHNYQPAWGALRNICSLPRAKAAAILTKMRASGHAALKPDYFDRRLRTERWLLAERTRKLGRPHLRNPIYFFLGDFADGRDPARPASLVVPLDALPPETMTFTYPDSMASLPLGGEPKHALDRQPYHGKVFTLTEITQVVKHYGLPGPGGKAGRAALYDRFIEVQVWDGRPLRAYLEQLMEASRRR